MPTDADAALISIVNRAINLGHTKVLIPMSLVTAASVEGLETARQLCALNGVRMVGVSG
jgi:hypothetical protein